MIRLLYITGIAFIIILLGQLLSQGTPGQFLLPESKTDSNAHFKTPIQTIPLFSTDFASHESTPEVHSATAIELADNDIMAFWYGGTREGHKDVNIYANRWSSQTKTWGNDQSILTREDTKESTLRYIRKLGNPVVTRGPDNAIWLFYVSVSVGGWAGSSINLTRSFDEGQSWSPSRRLITSPFLNLSTLIKGAPIHYTDGTLGLPVYHEFLGKFGELLRINAAGEVIDKKRLSWGKTSLQPIILLTSSDRAVAMMRNHGNEPQRILTQTTSDAGQTWSPVEHSALPNPDAGIMGLHLINSSQLLLAFNNHKEEREDMSLAVSSNNGKSWQIIGAVEENRLAVPDKTKQFSYPWLLQTQNGTIHLLYTWHKSHIKHIAFDQGWLERQTTIRESDKQ